MVDKLIHPRCTCGEHSPEDTDHRTLSLVAALNLGASLNAELVGLCSRQQVVALIGAAVSVYSQMGMPDEQADEEISEALELVQRVRTQTREEKHHVSH